MGPTGMPFLNIRTFNDDETIDKSKCKFVKLEEFKNKYEHFLLNEGDIVVSSSGTLGKAIVIKKEDLPIMLNTSVIRFRAISEQLVSQKFLKYFLKTDYFYRQIQGQKTGMAIDNFGPSHLLQMQMVIPPIAEQHRIVAKLDDVMQKVETNKQRLEKIPKLLKRFRQSVLAAAVSGRLTEDWREKNGIVEEWEGKKLAECGEISGGITLNSKRQLLPTKMPYLRVGNVYSNEIKLGEIKTIGVLKREVNRALLKKGDLLIVEGNGSPDQIGRVAQWKGEIENCLHQNHLIKFRQTSASEARYILYYLLSFQGREQIEEASKSTSGLYTLSLTKVSNLSIELPPLEEQKAIVRRVEQLFAFADKLEARYTKAKAMLDKLPQSILAKAFRGELVPQNEDDEPASVLLEKIKAEKARMQKVRPRGWKVKDYPMEDEPLPMAAEGGVKYRKKKK